MRAPPGQGAPIVAARRLALAATLGLSALFYLAAAPALPELEVGSDLAVAAGALTHGHYGGGAVSALLGRLALLCPVGPLAFRLSAVAALAVALAVAAAVHITLGLAVRMQRPTGYALPLVVGTACLAAATQSVSAAATCATSGAVALALAMWTLEALVVVLEGQSPESSGAGRASVGGRMDRLRLATLLGLCLGEQPVVGGVIALCCLVTLGPAPRARSASGPGLRRRWLWLCGLTMGAAPSMGMLLREGLPRAWQPATVAPDPDFPALALLLAATAGALWLFRGPARGPAAVPPVLACGGSAVGLALFGPTHIVGQLLAPLALCSAIVPGSLLLVVLLPAGRPADDSPRPAAALPALAPSLLAATTMVLGYLQLQERGAQGAARLSPLTDRLCASTLQAVPARAVILTHTTVLGTLASACHAEAQTRPDVLLLPLHRLTGPAPIAHAIAREPALAAPLRSHLLDGHVTVEALQSLAVKRPVILELTASLVAELAETVKPVGLLHAVLADGVTTTDERGGARAQQGRYGALLEGLDATTITAAQRALLLTRYRVDAAYYDAHGDVESAMAAETRAAAIADGGPR